MMQADVKHGSVATVSAQTQWERLSVWERAVLLAAAAHEQQGGQLVLAVGRSTSRLESFGHVIATPDPPGCRRIELTPAARQMLASLQQSAIGQPQARDGWAGRIWLCWLCGRANPLPEDLPAGAAFCGVRCGACGGCYRVRKEEVYTTEFLSVEVS